MHLSARSASLVGVTTQMDESADACVIMITCREASPVWRCRCAGRCTCVAMLRRVRSVTSRGGTCAPASRIAPNSRCETSARPRSWAPSIETRETWSTDVMPRIGDSLSRSLTGHAALRFWARAATASTDHASADDSSEHARPSITVPGCAGLKMLRTKMGMRSSMHGAIAEGWRTCRRRCTGGLRGWPGVEDRCLAARGAANCGNEDESGQCAARACAPKKASSIASSYFRDSIGKASGTRRGSAVYTPSTFFHIVICASAKRAEDLAGGSVVCARKRR